MENPITVFDALGLFSITFEDEEVQFQTNLFGNIKPVKVKPATQPWTLALMNEVHKSLYRVEKQVDRILKEIAAELEQLEKCPDRYQELIKNLKHLKKIFEGMKSKFTSKDYTLKVYKARRNADVRASVYEEHELYLNTFPTTPGGLDTNWFTSQNKDADLLHELSHIEGTEDSDPNPYNDSYKIESLMDLKLADWTIYRIAKYEADQKAKKGK